MAHEIRKWACDHGCGYNTVRRKTITDHEPHCFRNPAVRACKTCKNDMRERIYPEDGGGFDYFCDVGERPKDKNAVMHCPAWEPKEGA